MRVVAGLNLALAFALELAMLVAFAYFGLQATDHGVLRWVPALALPILTAGVWALFFAPKAAHRLPMLPGILLSLGLFLLAAVALYLSDLQALAVVMGVAAVVHASLALVWRQW